MFTYFNYSLVVLWVYTSSLKFKVQILMLLLILLSDVILPSNLKAKFTPISSHKLTVILLYL